MVGIENISNISLNQLSKRFSAYGLVGKLVNSCADLELDALEDTSTLKKILGEDRILGEDKGKTAFPFRSYAKLLFSTNELPIAKGEKSNGFYRRLLILTMNMVPETIDTNFFEKLSVEWFLQAAVAALERMYENGRITESAGSVAAVEQLRRDSDTVEAFLHDRVEKIPEGRIRKVDLFVTYERYCLDMERQPLKKSNFYRSMRVKGFAIVKSGGTEYFKGIFFPNSSPNYP